MKRLVAITCFLASIGYAASLAGCREAQPNPAADAAGRSDAAGPHAYDRIRFTDVTEQAGLAGFRHDNGQFGQKWFPEQMGAGGGFVDYDGDGWVDVLLAGGGVWAGTTERDVQALRLFRNDRDGTFTEVTREVGLAGVRAYSLGVAAADYDNDGDEDVYVTTLGRNLLFRNDPAPGAGPGRRFTEVGREAGVADEAVWSSSPLFFDADRDGHVDLFVANYAEWSPEEDVWCAVGGEKVYCRPAQYHGIGSAYYHNDGDGTFTNRTEEAGFTATDGKSLGVAELDVDGNGWPDLAVVNDGEGDLLYVNNGDGTFEERGTASGFAYSEHGAARAGMGVDAGVVDSSGAPSLFVGNFSSEMIGVYRHIGNGLFLDRAAVSRIGYASLASLTFGLALLDVELDGDLDLFVANGHVYPEEVQLQEGITYRQASQLFLNRGDGVFDEANPHVGGVLTQKIVARGMAYADYDRDGDLDVLLTENDGPAHLWRNDLQDARFLRVRLEGRESNRDALGARVVASVAGLQMERRIRTGSSYLSQLEKAATFGLGGAARVDTLTIYWPSGRVDRFEDVDGNRELRLTEGDSAFVVLSPTPGPA